LNTSTLGKLLKTYR